MLATQRGLLDYTLARDLGLRDDNMSLAAVIDFEDEQAYLTFNTDEEHNRYRRVILAPIVERSERIQFRA